MVTHPLIATICTSSGWSAAKARWPRSHDEVIAARPKGSPWEVVTDAAKKASTNSPITSSITAAPRITEASGEDIFPASISVRAEMETLVAVSAPPRKEDVVQER